VCIGFVRRSRLRKPAPEVLRLPADEFFGLVLPASGQEPCGQQSHGRYPQTNGHFSGCAHSPYNSQIKPNVSWHRNIPGIFASWSDYVSENSVK
jgi:hypothetical protein